MERAASTASSFKAELDNGSGPRCQDTILGDVDAQTSFETTSKQSNNPPLSRGYTFGSGEDSMKLLELMELCTKLSNMLHKNRKSDLIHYALTVNLIIYTSCIQQFWATAKANTVNGERGTDCFPTAIIFKELARMGAKSTAWNEFSSTMASLIICLAINQKFNLSKYIFDAMVLDLEKAKDAQEKEIADLKKRVQKLERKKKSRTT
ncbi:hypothetical protein Tco_0840406 [Tanacetum coccineum]|uniref:Uncharacterized protein n=1 Tax=Tanacetum coccineum TaxID=301880 RepID=A0ABQ5AVB9_9ASTR